MAQAPQTPTKRQRVQIKVFDVDSGQELSSMESTIPVNGNGVIGGFSCSCTTSHFCVVATQPTRT